MAPTKTAAHGSTTPQGPVIYCFVKEDTEEGKNQNQQMDPLKVQHPGQPTNITITLTATSPDRAPFIRYLTSKKGSPVNRSKSNRFIKRATIPAVPPARVVFTPASARTRSLAALSKSKADPALKPYHPNQRVNVPSI